MYRSDISKLWIVNNYIGSSLFLGLVILGRGFKTKFFAPRKNYHDTSSVLLLDFVFTFLPKAFSRTRTPLPL